MTLEQIKQLAELGYSDYEIREELEKNKKEYPKKPVAPTLKAKHTPDDVIEYAEKLKQWNIDINEYEVKDREVDEYNDSLDCAFNAYLEEKSGLLDFDNKIQRLITSFHDNVFLQGNGVIQYYQEIETIVDFVNEIKKL